VGVDPNNPNLMEAALRLMNEERKKESGDDKETVLLKRKLALFEQKFKDWTSKSCIFWAILELMASECPLVRSVHNIKSCFSTASWKLKDMAGQSVRALDMWLIWIPPCDTLQKSFNL